MTDEPSTPQPSGEAQASENRRPARTGVLSRAMINELLANGQLIEKGSFLPKQVQSASYDLRLGQKCYLGSEKKIIMLSKDDPILTIPPQDVAVLSTVEKLKLPLNVIGRWNIRIGLIYQGVLLVSGPQVDPGYNDHLYCVLYNFSTNDVHLRYEDHIATIDFATTTDDCEPFPGNERKVFEDYVKFIHSQPMQFKQEMDLRLQEYRDRIDRAERLIGQAFQISVATALAVAALVIAFVALLLKGVLP